MAGGAYVLVVHLLTQALPDLLEHARRDVLKRKNKIGS